MGGKRKYQAFNPRNESWVKFELPFKVTDVKTRDPMIPFSNTPIRGNKPKKRGRR